MYYIELHICAWHTPYIWKPVPQLMSNLAPKPWLRDPPRSYYRIPDAGWPPLRTDSPCPGFGLNKCPQNVTICQVLSGFACRKKWGLMFSSYELCGTLSTEEWNCILVMKPTRNELQNQPNVEIQVVGVLCSGMNIHNCQLNWPDLTISTPW